MAKRVRMTLLAPLLRPVPGGRRHQSRTALLHRFEQKFTTFTVKVVNFAHLLVNLARINVKLS